MQNFIGPDGKVKYGIFEDGFDNINYLDHPIETPGGITLPRWLRKIKANQFLFIGITGERHVIGFAIVDLKILANGFFYVYDKQTKQVTETSQIFLKGSNYISTEPKKIEGRFKFGGLEIVMQDGDLFAKGKDIEVKAKLDLNDINPLRICTRAGYRDWVYVEKTNPVKISGELTHKGEKFPLDNYLASIDWTCGYMRRKTCWAWSSITTTLEDKRTLGLNLSCGVNETSFTENFFCLDGKRTKVDTIHFDFDNKDLYKPWRVTSFDGKVDLTFYPEAERGEHTNGGILATYFTQLMGKYDGTLRTDDGEVLQLKGCDGFAEDHYAKW